MKTIDSVTRLLSLPLTTPKNWEYVTKEIEIMEEAGHVSGKTALQFAKGLYDNNLSDITGILHPQFSYVNKMNGASLEAIMGKEEYITFLATLFKPATTIEVKLFTREIKSVMNICIRLKYRDMDVCYLPIAKEGLLYKLKHVYPF
ncbi:MAG TPA: hypothetical protein VN922_12740 [Bacteroidia bacterium]|nr:hypothetical protein [Bacteroidia bacterium]